MTHSEIFLAGDDPQARDVLMGWTALALATAPDAAPRLTVRLAGEILAESVISALVKALRVVRERGGAIRIEAETESLKRQLAVYGLDRVFAFPLDEPEHRRRFRGVRGTIAAVIALFIVLASLFTPARAQTLDAQPEAILAHVIDRNPALSSYQGRMHVDVHMMSFPFLATHLDGTTYYKRPSNYEVVFDRVPSYARGFEKLYTDIGDPANWQKHFVITLDGEAKFENRTDIALRLVQRVRGQIDHETVLVDPATWSVDSIRYDYYNGGHITMTQHFHDVGGHSLLERQEAEIAIPHVRATARGTYDGYRTNVAIDEAVFEKSKGQ